MGGLPLWLTGGNHPAEQEPRDLRRPHLPQQPDPPSELLHSLRQPRSYVVTRWWRKGISALKRPALELNMQEILRRYEETGVLLIVQDPDVVERALERITPRLDDISVGAAYILRGRR